MVHSFVRSFSVCLHTLLCTKLWTLTNGYSTWSVLGSPKPKEVFLFFRWEFPTTTQRFLWNFSYINSYDVNTISIGSQYVVTTFRCGSLRDNKVLLDKPLRSEAHIRFQPRLPSPTTTGHVRGSRTLTEIPSLVHQFGVSSHPTLLSTPYPPDTPYTSGKFTFLRRQGCDRP